MNTIKSALLTLALVMVTTMGFAQTIPTKTEHPMLSSEKENLWSKIKRAYSYQQQSSQKENLTANLAESESYYWADDNWFSEGKNKFQFQDDKLILRAGFYFDGEDYVLISQTNYEYEDGFLVQEVYQELNIGTELMENIERTTYGYEDINGEKTLTGILYSEWNDGWVVQSKDEFIFQDGVITEGYYYETENFNFIEIEKFAVSTSNDTTTITYYDKMGDEYVPTERELYGGFTPEELFSYYFNLNLELFEVTNSFPLLTMELPDFISQEYLNDTWENSQRLSEEKFYDVWHGGISSIHKSFDYWSGNSWENEQRSEVYFNLDSQPDSALLKFNFEPPTLETYLEETFTYNSQGYMVLVTAKTDEGEGMQNHMRTEIRWNNISTGVDDEPMVSKYFKLEAAYPNPFNPTTNIQYTLEKAGDVSIRVYDMLGREVALLENNRKQAGTHTLQFNAQGFSSGMYFVRMTSGNFSQIQSITLLK